MMKWTGTVFGVAIRNIKIHKNIEPIYSRCSTETKVTDLRIIADNGGLLGSALRILW